MKISIIGAAGTIGSCTAFELATQGLADELVMLDVNQNLLLQQVNDLGTAVAGRHNIIVRCGNDADLINSDIVIIAAGVSPRPTTNPADYLLDNLSIIKNVAQKIARFCPDAVVITATNPVDPLNYAIYRCANLDRRKVMGYSLNDSIRFRIMIAEALNIKPAQVEGMVIGEHGDSQVMLFSSVRINGKPTSLSEELKHNIRQQIPNFRRLCVNLGVSRTSGWTSAIGLSSMVYAITQNTGQVIPCSVVLDGEYGCRGLSMGVPAVLDKNGVKQTLEWELALDEKQDLEHCIAMLKEAVHLVDKAL